MLDSAKKFWDEVSKLEREEIIELIRAQDREQETELMKQVNRIEWVFANKLKHLTWSDGTPITERPLTNQELARLLDPPFMENPELTKAGFTIRQQKIVHRAADPVVWAKEELGAAPRVYQILILREASLRMVLRLGRRAGKTYVMAIKILHYAFINNNAKILVMAPAKTQVGLIYDEVSKLLSNTEIEEDWVIRSVTSPQYELAFSNGSTARFFTTGLKSGGKSDIARGQEAHMIILDEMDYMGPDDLDALYAMLQKTDENQPDKVMIGASTPTGRKERFYNWANGLSKDGTKMPKHLRFREFYFPSFVNPHFTKEIEEEFRYEYNDSEFRHEIEADWGEDAEGVYPRRFVEQAFINDWEYSPTPQSRKSKYLIGVDWDKYGAGPNIVVLEMCGDDHEVPEYAGKLRIAFREEIERSEYVLTEAVNRVIELNEIFNPEHIYIDRGYGDVQSELLRKHGHDNPHTGLAQKVKGFQFSQTIDIRDPVTRQPIKKQVKIFMVDNLRTLLERGQILFPTSDEQMYMQLISYVVARISDSGKPVFQASGSQVDHAHDALILACLAHAENYSDLTNFRVARKSYSVSNDPLLKLPEEESKKEGKNLSSPVDMFEPPDYEDEEDSSPISRRSRSRGKISSGRYRPVRSNIPRGGRFGGIR